MPPVKTWYHAAHKYLDFILRIAIEIEEFLEEFFGMQHENAFWLNFTVDKIVPLVEMQHFAQVTFIYSALIGAAYPLIYELNIQQQRTLLAFSFTIVIHSS